MTGRRQTTFTSPTGGYVVVGIVGEGEADWTALEGALASNGYHPAAVVDNDDGEVASSAGELLDVINGRRPVLLEALARASEYDTPTLAGFRTEWRAIGGARSITLLSLTPKEWLDDIAELTQEANR